MLRPSHRARPLAAAVEALPRLGCAAAGDFHVALVLDLLQAATDDDRAAMLGALRVPLWRSGRPELLTAAALLGHETRDDAERALLDAYTWRSHGVLASWLPEPARHVAEHAWHALHEGTEPPLAALVNLAELHRMRGEHGPARMLLGEAQQRLQKSRTRCGIPDRDYGPLVEAMDRCNAGAEPDVDMAMLSEADLLFLLETPDRSELRTDLWCTWRHADRSLRARLRGVFSGSWLGPLPGPLDAGELDEAADVRARLQPD